jgi:beta-lactamase regulating signal transducer with metallopeptidase domain
MAWWNTPGTLGLVVEYFFKTTAVLTLALLAAAAARRRPAAFRHFVLSFALVGLLLLPVLSLAPVGWRTPLLPARPAPAGMAAPVRVRPTSSPARAEVADMTPTISRTGPAKNLRGGSPGVGDVPIRGSATPPPEDAPPSVPLTSRAPFTDYLDILLAALWSAGLIALLLRLAFGLAGAVRLTAEGKALADPVWRVLLERFVALVSLRRKVVLKSHAQVFVPLTWGWRKPVVLMPAGADTWTEEERSSALFHELSHVKRADFLVMLAVRASLAVFWWNPLCWIVYRELRKDQEIACDEMVLRAGIRPSSYAASLLAFRRSAGFRWNPSAALLGMLGRASFHERLAAILKQKLTFKEVKMKTRIMLAAAVVLAVSFVGSARPAAGIEKVSATTTVVETAAPAAEAIAVALPAAEAREAQAEQAVVQEKEKEKAKAAEKAKEEKKIAVTVKEVDKAPIVVTITEGDVVKTMTLDKPLTITSGKDGNVLVLTTEGKEIQVLKGEPLRLEIKGGEIELIKEGKALKVGKDGVYTIVREGEKDGRKIVFYGTPKGQAVEPKVHVVTEGEGKERNVEVVVETEKAGRPKVAWTVKAPGKEGNVWVTKELSGKPGASAVWIGEGGKAFTFSPAGTRDMLEKVRAIREQVEAVKAKKMDFAALEESLKKLEAELQANEDKLKELKIKLGKVPDKVAGLEEISEDEGGVVVFEKRREDMVEGKGGIWVAKADQAPAAAKVMVTEGNAISIVLSASAGEGMDAAAFKRVVANFKKQLPEGYELQEQEFDEQTGTMTFKIVAPEGAKIDETLVRKLVDSAKAELKTKK